MKGHIPQGIFMADIETTSLIDRNNYAFPLASFLTPHSLSNRNLSLGLSTLDPETNTRAQALIEEGQNDIHHTYLLTAADMGLIMPLISGYAPTCRRDIFAATLAALTATLPDKPPVLRPADPFIDRSKWIPGRLSAFTEAEIASLPRSASKLKMVAPAL